MKKKLLSLVAVTAALTTAGCALVACSGDEAKTQVTKEQWVAAFNVDNFTSNFKAQFTMKEGEGDKIYGQESTLVVGPGKYGDYSVNMVRFSGGVKSREIIEMRVVGAEKDTLYGRRSGLDEEDKWEDGEWEAQYKDHFVYDNEEWEEDVLGELGFNYIKPFAKEYDNFKYENGVYVLPSDKTVTLHQSSDSGEGYSYSFIVTASKVTIKFENNKLASVSMTVKSVSDDQYGDEDPEHTEEEGTCDVKITYGGQKVTPPAGVTPTEPKDDEE